MDAPRARPTVALTGRPRESPRIHHSQESDGMALRSPKVMVAAGATALVLVGAAIGVASAQQAPTGQNRYEQFITALAAKLHISPDTLKQDIQDVRQEQGWAG